MKSLIAVVSGGFSGENPVSRRSADCILRHIDRDLFYVYDVVIDRDEWYMILDGERLPIDRSDFSVRIGGYDFVFEYAFITVHGTPGEDGLLQGYFDLLGIPYNTGGVLCEALTFDKHRCKQFLAAIGISSPRGMLFRQGMEANADLVEQQLGWPVFVKPNRGGSSLATIRADNPEEFVKALAQVLAVADEALVEEFVAGKEVTSGCLITSAGKRALPLSEVVLEETDFFDFEAKYEGKCQEITPARLDDATTQEIQSLTLAIAEALDARGFIRVDYIIRPSGEYVMLEVNTTPGMTEASFIPQQLAAAKLPLREVLTEIIRDKLP